MDEATARRAMGKTPKMIEFFNKAIGTPYAYPKYATACLPEFGGGMEHTSATTMTDIDPPRSRSNPSNATPRASSPTSWPTSGSATC